MTKIELCYQDVFGTYVLLTINFLSLSKYGKEMYFLFQELCTAKYNWL